MNVNYESIYAGDFIALDSRYEGVENYVKQMAKGNVRSLIVNGPPGVGKTYSVQKYLENYANGDFKIVSGHITFLSLYSALYHYKEPKQVLVLDDTDSIFSKIEGLNLLKAAMDTKAIRNIHWESSSGMLNTMELPQSFEFYGGVILISNIGFGGGSNKLVAHLNALKDRSFCIPVSDSGEDSAFKQVCYMVLKRGMLNSLGVDSKDQIMLLDYMNENKKRLNTISLRTVVKLAEIYKMDPKKWRAMANQGLLKG